MKSRNPYVPLWSSPCPWNRYPGCHCLWIWKRKLHHGPADKLPDQNTGCRGVCSVVCIEFYFVYCYTYWRARDTAECVASYCGRATMSARQTTEQTPLHPVTRILETFSEQFFEVPDINPFTNQELSMSNFHCSLIRNITSHGMRNLTFSHHFFR